MSMPSQKSTGTLSAGASPAKSPQRARGHARVAALLEAASLEFAEKGYDGATMTAIAARAGSSIGSLYQFFPTKEQIAAALLESYLNMHAETFRKLRDAASTLDFAARKPADESVPDVPHDHPAFVVLVETYSYALPGTVSIRERLRGEIESVLATVAPHLAPAEIAVRAAVIQQLMKAAVAINDDTSIAGRKAAIDELEGLMQHYLHDTIKPAR
jgi:AcrR family transcriptional regulator